MTHQVLALKWRPKTLNQVKGQQAVVNSLTNSLDNAILQNCYLFTGTRGVGKTTLARILAKSMNCLQGISATPCTLCYVCRGIEDGNCPDVIEVDAASKTKVDDMRELLENISYAPINSRFKIYIIDEVHMLSSHSFNALLKTIEEPPAHVKFILATTEPKKIPITILSRSSQYHLKAFSTLDIQEQLANILTAENIAFTAEALTYLATLAHGSMRDALTLTEQAISYHERSLKLQNCEAIFGLALEDHILNLITLVIKQETAMTLKLMRELLLENIDLLYTLKKMQSLLFSISLLQIEPQASIDWPLSAVQALANSANNRNLQVCYQAVVNGARDLTFVPDQKIGFQMIILRMLSFQTPLQNASLKPASSENNVSTTTMTLTAAPVSLNTEQKTIPAVNTKVSHAPNSAPQSAVPSTRSLPVWGEVITHLNLKGLAKVIAENCVLAADSSADLFSLQLDVSYKPLLNDKIIASIAQALSLHYTQEVKVSIAVQDLTATTPAMHKKQLNDEVQSVIKQELLNNTNVVALQQMLNAKIQDIKLIENS